MGNGSSSNQQPVGQDDALFSLSDELQAKILGDFNNEQIQKMFGKQVNQLEENKFNRLRGSREERAALANKMEQWREQNNQVQKNLDLTLESLEARYADLVNIVEYDANRLESEHLNDKSINKQELPCLKVRTDVAACLAGNEKDARACDAFVQALEDCTTTTITSQVAYFALNLASVSD